MLTPACVRAAKLGLAAKGKGGFLQRAFSGRKAARSDYEEQQMLLGLKAVEKMKQMVLVRQSARFSRSEFVQQHIMPACRVSSHHACFALPPRLVLVTCRTLLVHILALPKVPNALCWAPT